LFSFKYFNFFTGSVEQTLSVFNIFYHFPTLRVLLPVGISFYTFQTLSYTIEVYRGKVSAERDFSTFALYVAFFPQLVAGPIERADRLLPQLKLERNFDQARALDGLQLAIWGFFKKVVVADRLALLVNHVYADPGSQNSFSLLLATYFFAFQIYCDFSGYSDIAIGTARILGVDLMKNFNRPYHSKSIHEFWSRWHISLSTWFRDYLYIPLGGNRVSRQRWYANIMIVFLVSGLWHGANWTFVVWGMFHGLFLLVGNWTAAIRARVCRIVGLGRAPAVHTFMQMMITFHLVLVSWIFFRAQSISSAWGILTEILRFDGAGDFISAVSTPGKAAFVLGLGRLELAVAVLSILAMEVYHLVERHRESHPRPAREVPVWRKYAVSYLMIIIILIFGEFTSNEFIYFQF
jgi:D-alanyl-lipoteichoic acid acyltransferase DltB (MBOAT superfamily)